MAIGALTVDKLQASTFRADKRATSTRDVVVTNKQLEQFPTSMMEQLRKLGMPVQIDNGKIVLRDGTNEYRICKEGQVLSAEQTKLLVHFDIKVAEFKINLVCRWSDGEFEEMQ